MSIGSKRRRVAGVPIVALALVLLAAACSSSSETSATSVDGRADGLLNVPQEYPTIQAAVDATQSGDLVLVAEGTYKEAVDVTKPDITIRGVDRNKVILDGEFTLENGIRVLDTDGVVVENMTARNYLSNGFFWTGSDRYRGSYLTAYRNGDYGVYAFDAYHGQLDHSYGGGSPDAGFYIGECFRCDAVIDDVISEHNGIGYSGTNSGGDLYIVNSTFRNNRSGILPNSGSYELCYPGRQTTIVGNTVHDNNNLEADAIDNARLAHGNGILLAGAIDSVVERNLVYNHDRAGIVAAPFPEEDANDVAPPASEHDTPCEETRDDPVPEDENIGLVLWHPTGNRIIGNVVEGSGLADIASGTIDADGVTTATLNNCFSDNVFSTSAPLNLEELAPCDAVGNGGDFTLGTFDLVALIADMPAEPPENTYRSMPVPGDQPTMPDAATAPAPRFEGPTKPDLDAIVVPTKPAG
jgi:hypothetical protein